jgi:hypothetical protein
MSWRRRRTRQEQSDVDTWVQQRLSVEVPEDSFGRVWVGFRRRLLITQPAPTLWELALTVQRLQWWSRGLAAALVLVTAGLVLVLSGLAPEQASGRSSRAQGLALETGRRGAIFGPSPADIAAIPAAPLRDRRIVYDRALR